MKRALSFGLFLPAFLVSVSSFADQREPRPFPSAPTFTTLVTTPLAIEGLTGDAAGRLYTSGRSAAGLACPVWRIDLDNPTLTVVGYLPAPATGACSSAGHAFSAAGELFISSNGQVFRLTPSESNPPTAAVFATGVPGTNGLAFDRAGNLWTTDGGTAQGRVWRITPDGTVAEMFRIPPMRNSTALGGAVSGDGVGRQNRAFPPGAPTNTAGAQDIVANGVAFDTRGTLLVADTARGALWEVELGRDGRIRSRVGCDTTFAPNTLCLDAIRVAHPALEGADGIALDRADNIWVSVNERNAVVAVTTRNEVVEVFRNAPDPATLLRNGGPLEFPTSPFLSGRRFCTASSDLTRRDNAPATAGEIGGPGQPVGKISCMDQPLRIPGLPLPVD
jgi:hypothetical protein